MADSECISSLPFHFGPDTTQQFSLLLVRKGDAQRASVETFVQARFKATHRAEVRHFMPELHCVRDAHGAVVAVVGVGAGADEPLFLEKYLQEPAQSLVARVVGTPVGRGQLVEVGNLAVANPGGARLLIVAVTWLLASRGFEWVVFTGVGTLFNSFRRLGLQPMSCCIADPARLGAERAAWGTYYQHKPQIFAGNIRLGLSQLAQGGVLARLGFPEPAVPAFPQVALHVA